MAKIPAQQKVSLLSKILAYCDLAGSVAGVVPESHVQVIGKTILRLSKALQTGEKVSEFEQAEDVQVPTAPKPKSRRGK